METKDIIFELKQGIEIGFFDDTFKDFRGKVNPLYKNRDKINAFRRLHPEIDENMSDKDLFWQIVYPAMTETEQKLSRTYIITGLDVRGAQEFFSALKNDSEREDGITRNVQHGYVYKIPDLIFEETTQQTSWGIGHMGCLAARQLSGSEGDDIIVAVIDSGVNYKHELIMNNMWSKKEIAPDGTEVEIYGHDYINDNDDPMDELGHGTFCAGIIAAEWNDDAQISVAPKAKIMAMKIFGARPGWLPPNYSDTPLCAQAIVDAADAGAHILSNSWEWAAGNTKLDDALQTAINHAFEKNCIIIFGAGNRAAKMDGFFPVNEDDKLIAVAGVNDSDYRTLHSNWGAKIAIAAPGVEITSLQFSNTTDLVTVLEDGTSLACPHVAGLVALVLKLIPEIKFEQLKTLLCDAGRPLPPPLDGNVLGQGKGAEALQSIKSVIGKPISTGHSHT